MAVDKSPWKVQTICHLGHNGTTTGPKEAKMSGRGRTWGRSSMADKGRGTGSGQPTWLGHRARVHVCVCVSWLEGHGPVSLPCQ